MTDAERETKAEEITRALKAALPGEPPRELAVLVLRVATLLRLEGEQPAPEPPRPARIRWHDVPQRPRGEREPRMYRAHW